MIEEISNRQLEGEMNRNTYMRRKNRVEGNRIHSAPGVTIYFT